MIDSNGIRLIWFCYGCASEVPYTPHCGRPATRMHSFDFGRNGRDWPRLRPPTPDEVVTDPETTTELEEGRA